MGKYQLLSLSLFLFFHLISAQFEDSRCKCVCNIESEKKSGQTVAKTWIQVLEVTQCSCENMLKDQKHLCPRCSCHYQNRNTTTMKVVVCIVVVIVAGLSLYMIILQVLEGRLGKQRASSYDFSAFHGASGTEIVSATDTINDVTRRKPNKDSAGGGGGYMRFDNGSDPTDGIDNPSNDELQQSQQTSSSRNTGRLEFTFQIEPSGKTSTSGGGVGGGIDSNGRPRSRSDAFTEVVDRARDQQKRWQGNIQIQRARVFDNHTLLN